MSLFRAAGDVAQHGKDGRAGGPLKARCRRICPHRCRRMRNPAPHAMAPQGTAYGPNSRSGGSRGGSFIEVKQSAKPFAATDGTRMVGRTGRWNGNDIA